MSFKDWLIKRLGGYTATEMNRRVPELAATLESRFRVGQAKVRQMSSKLGPHSQPRFHDAQVIRLSSDRRTPTLTEVDIEFRCVIFEGNDPDDVGEF